MTFDEKLEYVRKNKKIDPAKFDRVTDITNLIDFHNNSIKKKADDWAENEILEISKFLVKSMTAKTFIMGKR